MARIRKTDKTVLLLIQTLNRGGIENVLLRLIPKLKEEGWASVVVTIGAGGEMVHEYEQSGIKVISLKQGHTLSLRSLFLIRRQCQALQPDLIMTNLFKSDVIGRLFLRFTVKCPVVPYLVTTYNHPRYWIARVFEWFTKPLAPHYIANSEAVQVFYEKRLGVKPGKIVVAPNGVDTDIFQQADAKPIRQELGLPEDAFVVTCVANLAPNKGHADLLQAFETVFGANRKAYLLLVGDGEQREALLAQRETYQSKERIFLLGRRTDVPAILKTTTVFALATLFEGMSTALLEAMAAKKAIITTNIPENKVLLTDDKSALLVNPKDPQGLAHSLEQLYQDAALRDRLREAAFAYVEENYSITNMAKTFATIFNTICDYPLAGKQRIVHVISSLESGGAENMLLRTLPLLNQTEYEHVVVTLFKSGELAQAFNERGIKTITMDMRHILDRRALSKLVAEIKQLNAGLVVTYLFHASLIGKVYLQRRLRIPVIPFLRTTYNSPRYFLARLTERLTRHAVPHYFANSEAVKRYYETHLGVKAKMITVIHNGIDIRAFERAKGGQIVQDLKLAQKRVVITCVANLAANKGHSYLLQAFEGIFSDHPEAYLLIVGEGAERSNLERQAATYASKEHIIFLGRRSDVPNILAITDIFVLPTQFEGLSNALLEAMAAKCAVVTTDIPENRVIITSQKTGMLVPVNNAQAIQKTLRTLLRDKEKRQKLGQQARAYIKDHFGLDQIVRELDNALQSHLRPSKGKSG